MIRDNFNAANPARHWAFFSGRFKSAIAAALIVAVTGPSPTLAQSSQSTVTPGNSPDEPVSTGALEEVMVTATRLGAQSLQKTPIPVAVLSPDSLAAYGLDSQSAVLDTVPSVNMQSESPGINRIDMRGLTTDGIDITVATIRSLVGVYLDDLPLTLQMANPDLKIFDLERVEVIRGPQGTLFGAGSMAGTIRYITKKPDLANTSGWIEPEVAFTPGGAPSYSVKGVVNLPLVPGQLGMQIGFYHGRDGGYIDNLGTAERNANSYESDQGRLALRWLPIDNLTLDFSTIQTVSKTGGTNSVYADLGNDTYTSNTAESFTDRLHTYNLSADFNVSGIDFISSTSDIRRVFSANTSYQALDDALLINIYPVPANEYAPGVNSDFVSDFTQEFRIQSSASQRLRWIVGAFYERSNRYYPETVADSYYDLEYDPLGLGSSAYGVGKNVIYYGVLNNHEHQIAEFGELTYALPGGLNLTAGVRHFNFAQNFDVDFRGIAGSLAPGQPSLETARAKANGNNPRLNVSYQVNSDHLVFAEAAKGFRYGGANEPVPLSFCGSNLAAIGLSSAPVDFGPDHLWSYTLGDKSTIANGRATVNTTLFYIDWTDVQTNRELACGYSFLQNKGRIKSKGVEFESTVKLTDAWTANASVSYTDAAASGPIPNLDAVDGDKTPYFPTWIATESLGYRQDVGAGHILLNGSFTYRSNEYTQFNSSDPLYRTIPAQRLLNTSASYIVGSMEFGLFANNLLNNHLVTEISRNTYGQYQPGDLSYIGRPRTIGMRFRYTF